MIDFPGNSQTPDRDMGELICNGSINGIIFSFRSQYFLIVNNNVRGGASISASAGAPSEFYASPDEDKEERTDDAIPYTH